MTVSEPSYMALSLKARARGTGIVYRSDTATHAALARIGTQCARLGRKRDPCTANLAEQMRDFIQGLDAIAEVRLHELAAHVVVEVIEIRGERAAFLEVETTAQLVDDRHGAAQQVVLLGECAVTDATPGARNALERAVHQH